MRVSIWDLDYYYASDKKNLINPDVQKIASFHKQQGDTINFILSPIDINRPYDIYYIIKENINTPNPPLEFMTNSKVRWWGKAYEKRRNWKMSDAMLACRPDYLLYPNRDTRLERAERIRLIGNTGNLLPITQDWTNTFADKDIIVDDSRLWYCEKSVIIEALKRLQSIKSVSFAEHIWIDKIRFNPDIEEEFFKLQLSMRSNIILGRVTSNNALDTFKWLKKFKQHFPNCPITKLPIVYSKTAWKTQEEAQQGFKLLKDIVIAAKKQKILIEIITPISRQNTPFFFIPEVIEDWTKQHFKISWLEYLSTRFVVQHNISTGVTDWNKPNLWPPVFRDLIRQTYKDKEFLLLRWGDEKVSELEVPWTLWDEEFKYGI